MSADNWAICPRCCEHKDGDVVGDPDSTLREDYELGIDHEGCFHVVYSCSCKVCKFRWQFEKHDYVEEV